MKKWSDQYFFGFLLLTIAIVVLLAKVFFPSDEDINVPSVEFESACVSKRVENTDREALFDNFNQSLMTLKKMDELLIVGLEQLQNIYQQCEERQDKHICDDFLVKQQRLSILGNAFLSERHHLERLMDNIRLLKEFKEAILEPQEQLDVND